MSSNVELCNDELAKIVESIYSFNPNRPRWWLCKHGDILASCDSLGGNAKHKEDVKILRLIHRRLVKQAETSLKDKLV